MGLAHSALTARKVLRATPRCHIARNLGLGPLLFHSGHSLAALVRTCGAGKENLSHFGALNAKKPTFH